MNVDPLQVLAKLSAVYNIPACRVTPPFAGLENFDYGLRKALDPEFDWQEFGYTLLKHTPKQTLLIAATAMMLLAIIVYLAVKHKTIANMAFFSLILVVSGGIGNLIDRMAQGYVVDFIRFAFWDRFPTFNVADIAITVGVALLLIYILFIEGKKEKKRGTA